MNAEQVTKSELKRRAPAYRAKIDAILATPGVGAAYYTGDRGSDPIIVSFGGVGNAADVPYRYPPSNFGRLSLAAYVLPNSAQQVPMVSPLKAALSDAGRIPQIHLPPRGPSHTVHPDIRR
jgi:hypothetical protein